MKVGGTEDASIILGVPAHSWLLGKCDSVCGRQYISHGMRIDLPPIRRACRGCAVAGLGLGMDSVSVRTLAGSHPLVIQIIFQEELVNAKQSAPLFVSIR